MNADGSNPTELAHGYSPTWGPLTGAGASISIKNDWETWQVGSTHPITWTQTRLTGTNVELDICTHSENEIDSWDSCGSTIVAGDLGPYIQSYDFIR